MFAAGGEEEEEREEGLGFHGGFGGGLMKVD
jgi:hypothetical protein